MEKPLTGAIDSLERRASGLCAKRASLRMRTSKHLKESIRWIAVHSTGWRSDYRAGDPAIISIG